MRLATPVAAAVDRLCRAGLHRGVALFGADIDADDVLVLQRLQHGDGIQAQPPCPDQHDRLRRLQRHRLLDRGIDRDAGARVGRGNRRIEAAGIDQMPRMRGDDMGAVAAIGEHAQAAGRDGAHVVVFGEALLALAATQPGKDDAQVAGFHAGGVGTKLHHAADDFVAHRQRQDDAAVLQRHLLAAADIVVTVPDMQVGVADAAIGDLQQDLGALGFGRRQLDFLQGLPAFDDGPGAHVCLLRLRSADG